MHEVVIEHGIPERRVRHGDHGLQGPRLHDEPVARFEPIVRLQDLDGRVLQRRRRPRRVPRQVRRVGGDDPEVGQHADDVVGEGARHFAQGEGAEIPAQDDVFGVGELRHQAVERSSDLENV